MYKWRGGGVEAREVTEGEVNEKEVMPHVEQ